ncbi:MAG: ComEC/Rec2 family competence protein [Bacteroidaceae bacterium]
MRQPDSFHKYPFLRFVVPLILGIYLCDSFFYEAQWGNIVTGISFTLGLLFLILPRYLHSYPCRWLFGAGTFSLLFCVGVLLTNHSLSKVHHEWENTKTVYAATLIKSPQEKANSILCTVKLTNTQDSTGIRPIQQTILLYLPKDSAIQTLSCGNRFLVYTQVSAPHNNGNPNEFDYATYLYRKGISGTAYARNWQLTSSEKEFSLRQTAAEYRENLLKLYHRLGFNGDEFAVLSALTLGYKDELSEEIQEAYSVAGVSHVLALSGLHIGLLYLLLDFFLRKADKRKPSRIIKQLFLIACLWSFAFITGLSPSVVRSVTMFSLVSLSRMSGNRPVTLNTLGIAAFIMMLYNPFYLYDVSFQLSFVAVAAIVIIQPWLYAKVSVRQHLWVYLWGLITVSIAAQIGTAPLVLYYFSRYSVHFLLTNIVVIPMVTIILYVAIGMLLFSFWSTIQLLIASFLKFFIHYLNSFTTFMEQLPASSIDNITVSSLDVVLFYLCLTFGAYYLTKKSHKALLSCLMCIFIICGTHVYNLWQTSDEPYILIYNAPNCPSIHFVQSRKESYLASSEQDSVMERLKYATERFWNKEKLASPLLLPAEYNRCGIWKHGGIIRFHEQTVCMVTDDCWKYKEATYPLTVDYLYISKGYKGRISYLTKLFNVKKVVLDSSLSSYRLSALKAECNSLAMDFISISEKGSLLIRL